MRRMGSTGRSRNSRLNQMRRHTKELIALFQEFEGVPHTEPITDSVVWHRSRELVALIGQCVHEANAYNNALMPEGREFDDDVIELLDKPATIKKTTFESDG